MIWLEDATIKTKPAYLKYGARGITVCEEWRYSPDKFIEWCEKTHPGNPKLTIDRIDGEKGYSPDNCRWVTQLEQVHNLKTNRFITIDGQTRCITEWCSVLGISSGSVYKKVHKGMSFEDAIKDAVLKKRKITGIICCLESLHQAAGQDHQ